MICPVRHSYPLNISSFQLVLRTTNTLEAGRDLREIEKNMRSTTQNREMASVCTINILTNPHIYHTMVGHNTIAASLVAVKRDTIIPSTAVPSGKPMIITLHTKLRHVVPSTPSSTDSSVNFDFSTLTN